MIRVGLVHALDNNNNNYGKTLNSLQKIHLVKISTVVFKEISYLIKIVFWIKNEVMTIFHCATLLSIHTL